jgi:2,4-diketo-3-deoxy-L-fuconate hydrolase
MKFGNLAGRAVVLEARGALDLNASSGGALPEDPMQYVDSHWRDRAREHVLRARESDYLPYNETDLDAPVPRPGKILAVALNYRAHATESERDVPEEPSVFPKLTSSLTGPFGSIDVPESCVMVDYEAEVVLVIGRTMRQVQAADAWQYVAGVTAGQDISDRSEQRRPPNQFALAKSYDTFSPIGPLMATLDEFEDLDKISVVGRISGQEVQRGHVGELIYSIPELLAWTCRYVTLEPGDLVFTGTPDGVGSRRQPPLFLADGMVVETEIPEVGVMRNRIRSVPEGSPDARSATSQGGSS